MTNRDAMTNIDTGAATRANVAPRRPRQPSTPSELFISVRQKHPNDTRDEIIERFADIVESGGLFVRELATDWGRLNCNRLIAPPASQKTPEQRKKEAAERDQLSKKIADAVSRSAFKLTMSLELVIDGRRLVDWTFEELAQLAGPMVALSKMGKPKQRVGDVFKDDEALKAALRG